MPTLQDLSELLAERAERSAPEPQTVIARLERAHVAHRSPVRRAMPLLAAAAVVAFAIGVTALAGSPDRGARPASHGAVPPMGHIEWRFAIGKVRGWTAQRTSSMWMTNNAGTAGDWGQGAVLRPVHGRGVVFYGHEAATVTYPGNFSRAHPITVAGHRGLWVPGHRVDTVGMIPRVREHPWQAVMASGDPQPQLRWRNDDGTWNSLGGTVGFRPASYDFDNVVAKRELLRIAAAVMAPSSVQYVAAPFHATLGKRYRVTDVNSVRGIWCVGWSTIVGARSPDMPQSVVTVCRAPAGRLHDTFVPKTSKSDDVVAQRRTLPDGTVLVIGVSRSALTRQAAHRVLSSAKISSSMTDETTWLPV